MIIDLIASIKLTIEHFNSEKNGVTNIMM